MKCSDKAIKTTNQYVTTAMTLRVLQWNCEDVYTKKQNVDKPCVFNMITSNLEHSSFVASIKYTDETKLEESWLLLMCSSVH
jgi:hypothetical protein